MRSGLRSIPNGLMLAGVMALALTSGGCSPEMASANTGQLGSGVRAPPKALLAPLPAPSCESKGPIPADANAEMARALALDYERECYKRAEQRARHQLGQLQTSVKGMLRGHERPWEPHNERSQ